MNTLSSKRIIDAVVDIPEFGRWFADVTIDEPVQLSGRVELKIADVTLSCTVMSGGPYQGRGRFHLVGGAGGWGSTVPAKSYANDAGVKHATILGDAASEAGETIETISPSLRAGPHYTRPKDAASLVLEQLAPGAWYIDATGVTRLGKRAPSAPRGAVTKTSVDLARGTMTIAADEIGWIVPGLVIDGMAIVDVRHELSSDHGLRSTVWASRGSDSSRRLSAWRKLFAQVDPWREFRGVSEYRVIAMSGKRVDLAPVRVATGMPALRRVLPRPGVAGCEAELLPGSRVLVAFADADPARPHVVAFEDAEGAGFLPLNITIAKGVQPSARMGDGVVAGPFGGTITTGSALVKVG